VTQLRKLVIDDDYTFITVLLMVCYWLSNVEFPSDLS